MANIRTKLIHMLGGVTKEECNTRARIEAYKDGQWIALMGTLKVMEGEYGNPEWGDIVYNYVKDSLEELLK